MTLRQILIGLLFVAAGAFVMVKSNWIYEMFGSSDWADEYLHIYGGSRLFYKLIGFLIIVVGIFIMTNLLPVIILSIFGPVLGGLKR